VLAAYDHARATQSSDSQDAGRLLRDLCGSDRRRARNETRRAIATVEAILRAHRDDWLVIAAETHRTARGDRTTLSRLLSGTRVGAGIDA
jgi:hypothetical protein